MDLFARGNCVFGRGPGGELIDVATCSFHQPPEPTEPQARAHARLFAAAPRMHALLSSLHQSPACMAALGERFATELTELLGSLEAPSNVLPAAPFPPSHVPTLPVGQASVPASVGRASVPARVPAEALLF